MKKAQERDLPQAEQAKKNAPQQKADQRWKDMQDTQTKIFEIQKDVTANKARTQGKAPNKWNEAYQGIGGH